MPTRLRMLLESGSTISKNDVTGIIEVLSRLCTLDRSVEAVYLCNPAVRLISNTKKEGSLCGYRNIQMMISYIMGTEAQGFKHFPDRLPSILDVQDLIEEAWDKGVNSDGRIETGGIKGTRKYIGTPEVRKKCAGVISSSYDGCDARTAVVTSSIPPIFLERPPYHRSVLIRMALVGASTLTWSRHWLQGRCSPPHSKQLFGLGVVARICPAVLLLRVTKCRQAMQNPPDQSSTHLLAAAAPLSHHRRFRDSDGRNVESSGFRPCHPSLSRYGKGSHIFTEWHTLYGQVKESEKPTKSIPTRETGAATTQEL